MLQLFDFGIFMHIMSRTKALLTLIALHIGLPGQVFTVIAFALICKNHLSKSNWPCLIFNSFVWMVTTIVSIPVGITAYLLEISIESIQILTEIKVFRTSDFRKWKHVAIRNANRAKNGSSPKIINSILWMVFLVSSFPLAILAHLIYLTMNLFEAWFGFGDDIARIAQRYESFPINQAQHVANGTSVF